MHNNIIVATHHKTGTAWMSSIFAAIANELGVQYLDYWTYERELLSALTDRFILFNFHSKFPGGHSALLEREDVRVLHMIRDPRDVIISAMHFHRKSVESWLHDKSTLYDGLTYQERLNSLETDLDRYIFEMENASKATINVMLAWKYDRNNVFEVRYEDLIVDTQMTLWASIIKFLGFENAEQDVCKRWFWKYSLFGELDRQAQSPQVQLHLRSGKVAQWMTTFDAPLASAFQERFPNALTKLQYEVDDSWLRTIQRALPAKIA